jgi:hypothetical protein
MIEAQAVRGQISLKIALRALFFGVTINKQNRESQPGSEEKPRAFKGEMMLSVQPSKRG